MKKYFYPAALCALFLFINFSTQAQWQVIYDTAQIDFQSVKFIDEYHGWIEGVDNSQGHAFIQRTTDKGHSWINKTVFPYFTSSSFINDTVAYTLSGNVVYKTVDGGASWDSIFTEYQTFQLEFADENYGWLSHHSWSEVSISKDGGSSWEANTDYLANPFKFHLLNDSTYFTYSNGSGRAFFYSLDGGDTWNSNYCPKMYDFQMFATGVGYAVCISQGAFVPDHICRTTNFWASWDTLDLPGNGYDEAYPWALHFVSESRGWISLSPHDGNSGGIYFTSDGGNSLVWQYPIFFVKDFTFINDSIGWAIGDGKLLFTGNAGGITTGVKDEGKMPEILCYPNPMNSKANLGFSLASPSEVSVEIRDLTGRLLMEKYYGLKPAGTHEIAVDTGKLAPDCYLLSISLGNERSTLKILKAE